MSGLPLQQSDDRELRRVGAPYVGPKFPAAPVMEPQGLREAVQTAFTTVASAVDVLLERSFASDPAEIGSYLNLGPEEVQSWGMCESHDWALIARPDMVVTETGRPVLVELNAAPQAGLHALHDQLLRAQQPVLEDEDQLLGSYGRSPATGSLARLLANGDADVRVALACWRREIAERPPHWYYQCLVAELERLGIPACFCTAEEFHFEPSRILVRNEPVSAILRLFDLGEELENSGVNPREWATIQRLADYHRRQRVRLVTGFRGEVFVSKALLGCVLDERFGSDMPEELARSAARYLPWSRLLEDRSTTYLGARERLVDLALRHPERFVLKRCRGYNGREVAIGKETARADWEAMIEHARRRPRTWLIQEFVESEPREVTCGIGSPETHCGASVLSVFFTERTVVAGLRRVLASGSANVNAAAGALVAPVAWQG